MTLVLRYTARSDRGLVRGNNEDAAYAGSRLLALADGMGGHEAGEIASQLMIAAMTPLDDEEPGGEVLSKLEAAVRAGNITIAENVERHPERDGMGTTLTSLLFNGTSMGLAHVGDSRAYLLRAGELTQITRDDTYVQSLIDEGRITAEEAHSHPQRSLILKALTGHEVQPTLNIREALAGDRYLLCSDGLSDVVSASTIETVLGEGDVNAAADRLVDLALRSGGPDNITVVIAEVADSGFPQTQPIIAGSSLGDDQQHAPPPDTAAGRAAAVGSQQRAPVKVAAASLTEEIRRTRRRWRWLVVVALVLAVPTALAYGGRALLHTNFYAGAQGESIVVYRGVTGSVFGVRLQSVDQQVCFHEPTAPAQRAHAEFSKPGENIPGCVPLKLADLEAAARSSVDNLPSGSQGDVRAQIRELLKRLLPNCAEHPEILAAPPAAPPPPAGTSPSATATEPTSTTTPPPVDPSAPPAGGGGTTAPPPSGEAPFPTIDPNVQIPVPPPPAVRSWTLGLDCRESHS